MRNIGFGLLILALLSACTGPSSADIEQAQQTLPAFFDHLNKGEYALAAELYGGSYEILIDHNPSVDPNDHATLWQHACTINGAQCLTIRSIRLKDYHGGTFLFTVEFNNPDDSLFVQGPCCGGNETDSPPASTFDYMVTKTPDGKFKVMDLPVYIP